jgi:chromosome segregation ATPase
MSSRRQRAVHRPVATAAPVPAQDTRLGDMTEVDVIEAEIASLEQGMLQLRLQQQEAAARLQQIDNAIQQQIGAISGAQRLAQTMQQRAAERQRAKEPALPVEEGVPTPVA